MENQGPDRTATTEAMSDADGEPKDAPVPALPPVPKVGSVEDFNRLVQEVEKAAHDWGLRQDSLESRFVSALLGCTRWMGDLSEAGRADMRAALDQQQALVKDELARAKEMTKAAQVSLSQARQAGLTYEVERENLVLRMIKETLPLFIEKMQGTLVLKEKRLNSDIQRRRYAVAGLVTLALVCGGYGVRAWQDSDATEALGQCMVHPYQAGGHLYCQLK